MDINSTLLIVAEKVGVVTSVVKLMMGGVFGIYLILLFLRWKEYRELSGILREIRDDIRHL